MFYLLNGLEHVAFLLLSGLFSAEWSGGRLGANGCAKNGFLGCFILFLF